MFTKNALKSVIVARLQLFLMSFFADLAAGKQDF